MGGRIDCLVVKNISLSDAVYRTLFATAIVMWREGIDHWKIQTSVCDGEVRTERKFVNIGCIAGVEFTATVDSEKGAGKIRYVVRSSELDLDEAMYGGEWGDAYLIPSEDGYEAIPVEEMDFN